MQSVPDEGAYEAEDVSDHSRNHDEHNRRHRIEWFDEVNRLDRRPQKMKSKIGCIQPMRTRTDQTTCQPAITSPTLLGLVTLAYRKTRAPGIRWVIDQKPV